MYMKMKFYKYLDIHTIKFCLLVLIILGYLLILFLHTLILF